MLAKEKREKGKGKREKGQGKRAKRQGKRVDGGYERVCCAAVAITAQIRLVADGRKEVGGGKQYGVLRKHSSPTA